MTIDRSEAPASADGARAAALTRRQREIFDFISGFVAEQGYSPSLEEIAAAFGLSSVATVHKHVKHLVEKGYLRKAWNRSRSVEPVPDTREEVAPQERRHAAHLAVADEQGLVVRPGATHGSDSSGRTNAGEGGSACCNSQVARPSAGSHATRANRPPHATARRLSASVVQVAQQAS